MLVGHNRWHKSVAAPKEMTWYKIFEMALCHNSLKLTKPPFLLHQYCHPHARIIWIVQIMSTCPRVVHRRKRDDSAARVCPIGQCISICIFILATTRTTIVLQSEREGSVAVLQLQMQLHRTPCLLYLPRLVASITLASLLRLHLGLFAFTAFAAAICSFDLWPRQTGHCQGRAGQGSARARTGANGSCNGATSWWWWWWWSLLSLLRRRLYMQHCCRFSTAEKVCKCCKSLQERAQKSV